MPASAPADNPVVVSDSVPLEGVFVGAVLIVDAVEVLGGFVEVVLEAVMLEDRAELLVDNVDAADDRLEGVLVGANVENVAPREPMVTISVLEDTWNRPIPESQHPSVWSQQKSRLLCVTFSQLITLIPPPSASETSSPLT
jgi:hypothetical protein